MLNNHSFKQRGAFISRHREFRLLARARDPSSSRSESSLGVNIALIGSIIEASSSSLSRLIEASSSIGQLPSRAMRLIETPPAWMPPGPSGDQAMSLLSSPLKFLTSTRQYGRTVGLLLGTERIILVSDKKIAKAVMVDKSSSFQKEGTAFFPGSSLAGKGMLVIDGDLWLRQVNKLVTFWVLHL